MLGRQTTKVRTLSVLVSTLTTACVPLQPSSSTDTSTAVRSPNYLTRNSGQPCLVTTAGLVALGGSKVSFSGNARLDGDAYLLGNSRLALNGNARITGTAFTDLGASVSKSGNASWGALQSQSFANVESAMSSFASAQASLAPTQTMAKISGSQTIKGNGGLNVILVKGDISLSGNNALTIAGSPSDVFIFNVMGNISVSGNADIVGAGIDPTNLLFNSVGGGKKLSFTGNGAVTGTLLAPYQSVAISGNGRFTGAIAAGGVQPSGKSYVTQTVDISGNGMDISPAPFCIPDPTNPPTETATATATITQTVTSSSTATITAIPPTATITQTATVSSTATETAIPPTATVTQTATVSSTATETAIPPTVTVTQTATDSSTATVTAVPPTATVTQTATVSSTATETAVPPTVTVTETATASSTATATELPPSATATDTSAPTATVTETATTSSTATETSVPPSSTVTDTATASSTATDTSVPPQPEPPVITGFDGTTTTNAVNVIWQTANGPSTSQVFYGTDPSNLEMATALDSRLVTVHQMTVGNLASGTTFYLQAVSTNAAGETTISNVIVKTTK